MRGALALVGLLLVTAGCVGTPVGEPTGTSTTACAANPTYPNVTAPAKPDELTRERAIDAALAYESAYRRAWLREQEGASPNGYSAYNRSATAVDGGYYVTLKTSVKYVKSSGPNATTAYVNRGFVANYLVTDERFVRGGRTVACW